MPEPISPEQAAQALVAALGRPATGVALRPASGGMVSSVWMATFDGPPGRAVLKVSGKAGAFVAEAEGLAYLRARSALPVPDVLFLWDGELPGRNGVIPLSVLALEWIDGVPLGEAPLRPEQRSALDEQIGRAVAALHTHRREEFGSVGQGMRSRCWTDVFGPRLAQMVSGCDGRTDPETIRLARRVVERLDDILDGSPRPPTLVHGDIWANNILVDPDEPSLRAFIDPGAEYADSEYETAYLEVFQTVGPRFWDVYRAQHPAAEGYERRRLVYHLHTMLVHIWYFGDEVYHRRAAEYVRLSLSD